LTPFECYVTYLALKRHFTSNYDFVKYNGKVNANLNSFEKRKDRYSFYKLSRQSDPFGLLLSCIFYDPDIWIGDIFSEESNKKYTQMRQRFESLEYVFKSDLDKLDPIKKSLIVEDQHPLALKMYRRGEISPETLIILNKIGGLFQIWDKNIEEPYVWKEIRQRLTKLEPFLSIDSKRFKAAFKQKLTEQEEKELHI